ncbi:nuclear transport factor 2 family protein [Roseiconus nitratireducens]|uniref:Nuclear transport factor 2 family protein n=1 Tax=Roseiconus nitratireducens TaxID=2605748 RepID=A0A5M6CUB6_9BACT|nr:nuclear transport factor 2 family protein [Roseiconus nitratireducens]KAA5537960.1 nuclear transport factor 2 family protein [Roseiconus nitratireducens]
MSTTLSLAPPFNHESALAKVRAAEDAWNSKDPRRVARAYSIDSEWRNRDQFIRGRDNIERFLESKWERELDYRLAKSLWAFSDTRIAVRFQYEYRTSDGRWYRAYGNENWEFDAEGLMRRREASINDIEIQAANRRFTWPSGSPRPPEGFEITEVR